MEVCRRLRSSHVIGKLEGIWKEEVVLYSRYCLGIFLEGLRKSNEDLCTAVVPSAIRMRHLQNSCRERCCRLGQMFWEVKAREGGGGSNLPDFFSTCNGWNYTVELVCASSYCGSLIYRWQ
jgi:hypothetical protein